MSLSNTLFLACFIGFCYNKKTPIDDERGKMSLYALIKRLDCARRCMP